MTRNRLLVLVVAAALVAGVGVAAGTFESSVESTPDEIVELSTESEDTSTESTSSEVVDVKASSIPVESKKLVESAEELKSDGSRNAGMSGKRSESGEEASARSQSRPSSELGSGAQGPSDGKGDLRDRKQGPGDEQTSGTKEDQSLLETLLELLRSLLAALGSLLPGLVALAVVAAVAANRDRLAELLGGDEADPDGEEATTGPAPTNDVAQAWYELATLAGIEEVETTTPRQCAAAAVEAGADRSAVERLTSVFEEVRYGDRAVTEERRERAREGLRRARDGLGVER